MQGKFDTFFAQNNNQSVEREDASALDQCMDLAFAWCDALGIPREAIRHQYAYQVWANPTDVTRQYFDLIPNNPNDTNKPSVGDLVVFKQTAGIPVGHISIESGKSDGYNAITFDENWDTPHYHHVDAQGNWIPYSRLVTHANYYGVAGWLHPKNQSTVNWDMKVDQVRNAINTGDTAEVKIQNVKKIVA